MIEITKSEEKFCPNCFVWTNGQVYKVELSHKSYEYLCEDCLYELYTKLDTVLLGIELRKVRNA